MVQPFPSFERARVAPQMSLAGACRLAVVALCGAAFLAGCGPSATPGQGHGPGGPGGAMPAMPVSVRTVSLTSVPITVEVVGQAEGSKEVEIRARVSGLVEHRIFNEGQRVKAGALMYQIEREPFEIALQQARANLGQKVAELEQARREALRLKPLAEKQAISQREYDQAASSLSLNEAAVAQAQAQVRQAQLNLSYTSVTSPISGISGRSLKSEGSLVNPGADSLLTTVNQVDPIWVRFSLSESELAVMRSARQAQVQLLSDNRKVINPKGKLNFSGSTVDPRLGTVQLRAEFANPDVAVLPGQFVRTQVVAGEEPAFLVPQSAITQTEQGRLVWTIKDGKAAPTPVETGAWVGNDWAVRKGLKDGDQVIIDNLIKMRPGAPVTQATAKPGTPGSAPAASAASPPASASAAASAQ